MKKVLILVDAQNFYESIKAISKKRKEDRVIDCWKINQFVIEYLSNNVQYHQETLSHLRTYWYTGEVTDSLLHKINSSIKKYEGTDKEIKCQEARKKALSI